jgi:hypothetical protein
VAFRHVTAETLAVHVEQNRDCYTKIRPYINDVVKQKPVIQAAFRRLKALYPDMKFPAHVYFVVGPQKGAGMNSDNGIILAADMFATPPGTPYSYTRVSAVYVPYSAVHETIHFNQAYHTNDQSTLLQNVVSEGTADFIASLVLREPAVRQTTDRWQYGCGNEAEMAARLMREADLKITKPWMFDHSPDTGWPPDMGYWIGYRIAQAYYDRGQRQASGPARHVGCDGLQGLSRGERLPGLEDVVRAGNARADHGRQSARQISADASSTCRPQDEAPHQKIVAVSIRHAKLAVTSMEKNRITGGCYCGEVRFSASPEVRVSNELSLPKLPASRRSSGSSLDHSKTFAVPIREGNATPISDRDGSVEDFLRPVWNISNL